jgi:hypothetical protein
MRLLCQTSPECQRKRTNGVTKYGNGIDGNFVRAFISLVGDDMVSWNGYTIATRRERFETVLSELRSSEFHRRISCIQTTYLSLKKVNVSFALLFLDFCNIGIA